jgi:hypothetical protein
MFVVISILFITHSRLVNRFVTIVTIMMPSIDNATPLIFCVQFCRPLLEFVFLWLIVILHGRFSYWTVSGLFLAVGEIPVIFINLPANRFLHLVQWRHTNMADENDSHHDTQKTICRHHKSTKLWKKKMHVSFKCRFKPCLIVCNGDFLCKFPSSVLASA